MKSAFTVAALSALMLVCATMAQAQATRTWVSGVGDDVNPCSRTAPCKTFAGAISKTAAGGEINVLDPGGFGTLTITKSITVQADGVTAGVLHTLNASGIIINAGANDVVVLRGLDFEAVNTGGNAIRFLAGSTLLVENCILRNGAIKGIDFEPSGAANLIVNNTTIFNFNNGVNGGAIFVKPGAAGSAKVSLNNVQMYRNLYGLRAEDRSTVMVANSNASNNVNNGFLVFTSAAGTANMSIDNTVVANNGINGIRADGSVNAVARISRNTVTGNGTGLSTGAGGQIVSYRYNNVSGNTVDGVPTSSLPAPGTI
jgi:hypothetical protein